MSSRQDRETAGRAPAEGRAGCPGGAGDGGHPHHLASAAGLRVLQAGGNAVEAAIAAAAVLSVVCPHRCGVGGDGLWLIYSARNRTVMGLNASGRSGERCDLDLYRGRSNGNGMPARGAAGGLHGPRGRGRLVGGVPLRRPHHVLRARLGRPFDDAIEYAESGCPVSRGLARRLRQDAAAGCAPAGPGPGALRLQPGFARTFLDGDGRPPAAGGLLRQPELAATLRLVAREGGRVFYEGEVGRRLAELAGGERRERSPPATSGSTSRNGWSRCVPSTAACACTACRPAPRGWPRLLMLNILSRVRPARDGGGQRGLLPPAGGVRQAGFRRPRPLGDRPGLPADPAEAAVVRRARARLFPAHRHGAGRLLPGGGGGRPPTRRSSPWWTGSATAPRCCRASATTSARAWWPATPGCCCTTGEPASPWTPVTRTA